MSSGRIQANLQGQLARLEADRESEVRLGEGRGVEVRNNDKRREAKRREAKRGEASFVENEHEHSRDEVCKITAKLLQTYYNGVYIHN